MKAVLGAGIEELRGKLATFCGKRVFGKQQLTRLSVPYSVLGQEPSAAQLENRAKYGELVGFYLAASDLQKAAWAAAGEAEGISGLNWMLRDYWTKNQSAGAIWSAFGSCPLMVSPDNVIKIRYPVEAILLTTLGDFYRSTDNGANWSYSYVGLDLSASCILELDTSGTVILVDYSGGAIWLSTDGGANWDSWIQYKATGSPAAGLGISATSWLFVSLANSNIYRTTNSGSSYSAIASHSDASTGASALRMASGAMLTGFTGPAAVCRSVDNGLSWTKRMSDGSAVSVDYFADNGGVAVIAVSQTDALFYVSVDDGLTWGSAKPFPGSAASGRFVYADSSQLIFIESSTGIVHRSANNGTTWATVGNIGAGYSPDVLLSIGSSELLVDDVNFAIQEKGVPAYV